MANTYDVIIGQAEEIAWAAAKTLPGTDPDDPNM